MNTNENQARNETPVVNMETETRKLLESANVSAADLGNFVRDTVATAIVAEKSLDSAWSCVQIITGAASGKSNEAARIKLAIKPILDTFRHAFGIDANPSKVTVTRWKKHRFVLDSDGPLKILESAYRVTENVVVVPDEKAIANAATMFSDSVNPRCIIARPVKSPLNDKDSSVYMDAVEKAIGAYHKAMTADTVDANKVSAAREKFRQLTATESASTGIPTVLATVDKS